MALVPDHPTARFNLAYLLLRQERYEEGWAYLEVRRWYAAFAARMTCPRWAGEPLAGKSLLIGCEAGHGDMIHFVRYAQVLREQGARSIDLVCHPPLQPLFAGQSNLERRWRRFWRAFRTCTQPRSASTFGSPGCPPGVRAWDWCGRAIRASRATATARCRRCKRWNRSATWPASTSPERLAFRAGSCCPTTRRTGVGSRNATIRRGIPALSGFSGNPARDSGMRP